MCVATLHWLPEYAISWAIASSLWPSSVHTTDTYTNTHTFPIAIQINKNCKYEKEMKAPTIIKHWCKSTRFPFPCDLTYVYCSALKCYLLRPYLFIYFSLSLACWSIETVPTNAKKLCEFVYQRSLSPLHMHIGTRIYISYLCLQLFFPEICFSWCHHGWNSYKTIPFSLSLALRWIA